MRLAWLSPWPPDPSGIANRSAELIPILADRGHALDVFVDERRVPVGPADARPTAGGTARVSSAHDFLWRSARQPYDLVVYEIGNSRLHEFIWPYAWHAPGLVVLHDARLHHARGRAWLQRKRPDAYRREFAWSEPGVSPEAAELAIAGFGGTYYYQWPLVRAIVESAKLVAAHSPGAVDELRAAFPSRPVAHIALGEGRRDLPTTADRAKARQRLGLAAEAIVFGVFGGLTPEKRIQPILRVVETLIARGEPIHLLLAGDPDPRLDLEREIGRAGLAEHVTLAVGLDAAAFDDAIAAVDVSVNLRWPTAHEISGPWLRALAAARPTVTLDLAHLSHLPMLDPRTWQLHAPAPAGRGVRDAVGIGVDILDEDHSLLLAMRRLTTDRDLRERLGHAGRAYWETAHTVERMADDYERAFALALAQADPPPLPDPFRPDPGRHAREIVAPFGVAARLP
jgi:glycosyltransferase involved in cell wall biosynthesis